MRKVQVLGTGCPKCRRLAEVAEAAVRESGVEAEVVKVTDVGEISALGVMMTPALAVDGEVKSSGSLPGIEEVKSWLTGT